MDTSAYSSLVDARYQLARARLIEAEWRAARRKAGVTAVLLALPLGGLLILSVDALTRRHVQSTWPALQVSLYGASAAALCVSISGLGRRAGTRRPPHLSLWSGVTWIVLRPLLSAAPAAFGVEALFTQSGARWARPQTLYLAAFAFALALARLTPLGIAVGLGARDVLETTTADRQ